MDDKRHLQYTGVSNVSILSNLKALGRVHGNIWLRVPIIPEVNDSDDQLDAVADFAASVPGVTQVNLLPYHRTGVQKFKRLGREYRLEHVRPPSPNRMESALARFRAFGLNAKSGGQRGECTHRPVKKKKPRCRALDLSRARGSDH
jgi:pyruvate formate lyase activating enzyme